MINYYPIIAAVLAMVITQGLKPIFLYFKTGEFDPYQIIAAGGFPSSHTATMSSLATAFALRDS
ncbi:MAG: divergent PAP2 family protein, partial [Bacilli bacterium]